MFENEPAISIVGITKTHAQRAIRRLRRGSVLAFYRPADKSVNVFPSKFGKERDYEVLSAAIDATRRWS